MNRTKTLKIDLTPIVLQMKAVASVDIQKEIARLDLNISEQKFQNAFSAIGVTKFLSQVSLDTLRLGGEGLDDDGMEGLRWNGIFMIWGYTAMVYMRSEHLESGLDGIPEDSALQPFKKYLRAGNLKRGEGTYTQHIRNAFSHGTFKLSADLHTVTFVDHDWEGTFDTEEFLFGLCDEIFRFYYLAFQHYAGIDEVQHSNLWSKEFSVATENPIKFIKGSGKGSKAQFQIGNISVPASAFSRIEKEAEGKADTALARIFITGLGKKYQNFLEAVEERDISYQEAFQFMKAARPVPEPKGENARSHTRKEAVAIARALCRKYADKTPEEMLAAFMETVKSEAFQAEILKQIKDLETNYQRNDQGKIRVRVARPEMAEQAKKAQEAKKAKAEAAGQAPKKLGRPAKQK